MNGKSLKNLTPEQKKARRRQQMRKAEKKYEAKEKELLRRDKEVGEQAKYCGYHWLHWSSCKHDVKYFMETRNLMEYYYDGIKPDEAWGYYLKAKRAEEEEYDDILRNYPIIRYDRYTRVPTRFKNLEEATKDINLEILNGDLPLYYGIWDIRDELVKLLKKNHTVKCGSYVFQFGSFEGLCRNDPESEYVASLPRRKEK